MQQQLNHLPRIPQSETLLEGDALKRACAGNERLPMWTLYHNPSDYPGKFVARLCFTFAPPEVTRTHFVGDTWQEVAAQIPFMDKGRWQWMRRHPGDEPQIVGVWI